MITASAWHVDPVRILTRRELAQVLDDLERRAAQSANARMNRGIFRLACCCGLRVSEIAALQLRDVRTGSSRPHLRIRAAAAKGNRARTVPLWWDADTLADLEAWKEERLGHTARSGDHFVCCLWPRRFGAPLGRHTLRERFRTACKSLGLERLEYLTIHDGRHTFISHALAGGRTLAEVRLAAGHTSLVTTTAYLHVAVDDDGEPGKLFQYR